MPRPRKCRRVCRLPQNKGFLPVDTGTAGEPVILSVDEYESIRLIDKEGLSQEQCGEYMEIARTTVQQIYTNARRKLADALVDGLPLRIEGGDYQLCDGSEEFCGWGGCCHRLCKIQEKKESGPMKIAIPLDEDQRTVCVTFGRSPYILFSDGKDVDILKNPAADAQGGAGLMAAQFLVDQGATVLITIRCGENSAEVLKAADIEIYKAEPVTASENLAAFAEGKLEKLSHFHPGFQGIQ